MNLMERLTLMLRLAKCARRAKMFPGAMRIVGFIGRAETTITDKGTVFVRDELWRARSHTIIARGDRVRVTGLDGSGLSLIVEKD